MGKKDIIERLQDYAKDYTTTTYHDDLIQEGVTEIESLRQQLTSCDAEIERLKTVPMRYRRMAFNAQLQDENAQLSQQLADSQKQVTLLREAMQGAWKDGYCFVGLEGQTDEQKAFEQALAATADLKDAILCHRVAIGYRYELKAGEYTFSENRYSDERYVSRMTPLYRAWEPKK